MYSSRLFQFLKTLDKKEFRRYRELVHSPFFNKNKRLIALVDYISRYFPHLEHTALQREHAFKVLFPEEKFEEQKIYDLQTRLLKLLDQYFIQQGLQGKQITPEKQGLKEIDKYPKSNINPDLLLLAAMGERKADSTFERQFQFIDAKLAASALRDADHYHDLYLLHVQNDLFYSRFLKEIARTEDFSLQPLVDNLDLFYLSAKFSWCCKMINRQNVLSQQYDLTGLQSTLDYYEANEQRFGQVPAVAIYYNILKTLIEPETEQYFNRLLNFLKNHAHFFSQEEARSMYNFAENYCIKKINNGQENYLNKLYLLYQRLIQTDLILTEGYISQWDYKNIVAVGVRLEVFEWVAGFIEKFKYLLDPAIRENAYSYNLATFYFFTGEYGRALRMLQKVNFTDVFYELGARSIILKVFYELDEAESLFSHIRAFKTYLRRNRLISAYQDEIYRNLCDFSQKMFKLKLKLESGPGQRSKEKLVAQARLLHTRVLETDVIASLPWVRAKSKALVGFLV